MPLLRILLSIFRLLPQSFYQAVIGKKAVHYDGRTLQPRAQGFNAVSRITGSPKGEEDVDKMRQTYDLAGQVLDGAPPTVAAIRDLKIDLKGRTLAARLYDNGSVTEKKGLILYFHGGGFVIGGLKSHDHFCRRLARDSGLRVLAVDYRLAPEHPYPAPIEDALDTWAWLYDQGNDLHFDPDKVIVSGDSAGGLISMVIANHVAKSRAKKILKPAALGLLYPSCDMTITDPRYQDLRDLEVMMGDRLMDWFFRRYFTGTNFPEDSSILKNIDVSPALVPDSILKKWPPVYLMAAGFDPLRPGCEALRDRLQALDHSLDYKEYDDLFHGFITMSGVFPETVKLTQDMAAFFKKHV